MPWLNPIKGWPPPHLHDQYGSNINGQEGIDWEYYSGDGLWSVGAKSDPNPTEKDLYLEIDYDGDNYDADLIPSACDSLMEIFQTGGIHLHSIIGDAIENTCDWDLTIHDMRAKLVQYRDASLRARGVAAIHVIVGGEWLGHEDDGTVGVTVGYFSAQDYGPDAVPLFEGMRLGTTGRDGNGCNPYLDSCGCFVFENSNSWDNGNWDESAWLAVIIAHEVGHAIGLWHGDASPPPPQQPQDLYLGVMSSLIDPNQDYLYYNFFMDPESSAVWARHRQINLRTKLGCETAENLTEPVFGLDP